VVVLLVVGTALTLLADGPLFAIGVLSVLAFVAAAFALLVSGDAVAGSHARR